MKTEGPAAARFLSTKPKLISGKSYFSFLCKKCGHEEAVLEDPSNGKIKPSDAMAGPGEFRLICSVCKYDDATYAASDFRSYRHPYL